MHNKTLKSFFKFEYEEKTKDSILAGSFAEITEATDNYLNEIISIPLSCFVDYIVHNCKREPIMAADVFQFSDIQDATTNICQMVCSDGNTGLCFQDIGRMLLDDSTARSQTAFNKYGENHIKTAEALGLAFRTGKRQFYLSSTGLRFCKLPSDLRGKLLTRLILRNKLIAQLVLAATNGSFDLEAFLYDLSKSTYLRRRTNIKYVISMLLDSPEYDFSFMANNIIL